MATYALLLLLNIFLPAEKYVLDKADLMSFEEEELLNDYLTQLHAEKLIKFRIITVESFAEADSLVSQQILSERLIEALDDSTLYVVIGAQQHHIQLFSGSDGSVLPIPRVSREPLHLYGLPLIQEGSYFQGIQNTVDALTQKWGPHGESKAEKARPWTIWEHIGMGIFSLMIVIGLPVLIYFTYRLRSWLNKL